MNGRPMGSIVPPPFEVLRRAWECAVDLRGDFNARLPLAARIQAEEVLRTEPDALGWEDAGAMFRLHRATVGRQT